MRPAELRSPSAQGAARRKGTSSLWLKRNWLLVALFALALASAGMSVRLFIVPCEKKTEYTTHNTSTIVNVTSFENRSVLENARPRRGNLNSTRADAAAMACPDAPRRRSRSSRRSLN